MNETSPICEPGSEAALAGQEIRRTKIVADHQRVVSSKTSTAVSPYGLSMGFEVHIFGK